MPTVVKTRGDRGQIGVFIPDDPVRFSYLEVLASIDRGLRWLAENPPAETDLDDLERRLRK